MPDWWEGVETVTRSDEPDKVTFFPDGYPDFPMPQQIDAEPSRRRMVVSCQVSDLVFEWTLEPLGDQGATRISVHVEIPEAEAARLERQQQVITESLRRLAEIAAATPGPGE